MPVRGVRGAIVIDQNLSQDILLGTIELLQAILAANPEMRLEDIGSAIFSATEDLTSEFPARAAREMGWNSVPLMCTREMPVPGSVERCIRVLLHWNTEIPQSAIHHVYLGGASELRPDLKH